MLFLEIKIGYVNGETIYYYASYIGVFFTQTKSFLLFCVCFIGTGFCMFTCIKNELIFSLVKKESYGFAMGAMSLSGTLGTWAFSFLLEFYFKDRTNEAYFEIMMIYLVAILTALILAITNLITNYYRDCCHIYTNDYIDQLNENVRRVNSKKI